MKDAFLIGAARTPIGRLLSAFRDLSAPNLGAVAICAALARSGCSPAEIDEVIMGNVIAAGVGQAPARQAALRGGLPPTVAARTINKVCGSGLKAVMLAAHPSRAADGPRRYLRNSNTWFGGDEGRRIADNLVAQQTQSGGWPKNLDTTISAERNSNNSRATFDNGATTDELRFLARAWNALQDERYRAAFLKGMDYILHAQYANGGWPQNDPPGRGYHRFITFNDDAMVRLMQFLQETARVREYDFIDARRRDAARAAFDRGIECILKCQVRVNGKLTAWCAQHDEKDFSPRPARTFELASLSGSESVGIVELLMSVNSPRPAIVQAVEEAVAWLEAVKLTGIRQVVRVDAKSPTGRNKTIVNDPSAPPLWARFYEIGTNRPLFADRDGVPKYNLADIGYERRNGYSWFGDRPRGLIDREYPLWKNKWRSAEPQNGDNPQK
jgi:pectate lyase